MSPSILYLGLDVHKESVTIAVLPADAPVPTRVEQLPYDLRKLQRCFARLAQDGTTLRACYEASGAGDVPHRARPRRAPPSDTLPTASTPPKPTPPPKFPNTTPP